MYLINLNLQIICKYNNGNIPSKHEFQKWLEYFLSFFSLKREITIRIVDVTESQYLNLKYRGKNSPTNVLSFSYKNNISNNKLSILGDLVICHQLIEQEANEQHKNIYSHWAHMVIHGCLHLIGYDHKYEYESRIMQTTEQIIMNYLGFPNPY